MYEKERVYVNKNVSQNRHPRLFILQIILFPNAKESKFLFIGVQFVEWCQGFYYFEILMNFYLYLNFAVTRHVPH